MSNLIQTKLSACNKSSSQWSQNDTNLTSMLFRIQNFEGHQSYIHVILRAKIFVPFFFFVPDRALNPQPLDRTVIRSTYQNNTVATRKTHLNLVGIYYCRNRSRKIDSLMPGIPSYAARSRMFDPMNPLILIPVTELNPDSCYPLNSYSY